jgi:hypothetical protein
VEAEYARANLKLPTTDHFLETVWAYNELFQHLTDPHDGDALDVALPIVQSTLRNRLAVRA